MGDLYVFKGTVCCSLSQGTLLLEETEDHRYSSSYQYFYTGILDSFVSLDSWSL